MPKKDIEVVEDEVAADDLVVDGIAPIDMNFHREDMNALVTKMNEVIAAVNNL